jgi:hypothetical protein
MKSDENCWCPMKALTKDKDCSNQLMAALTWRNLEGYPAQPGLICFSVRHSVHPSVRAKRGIWSKRVFMRTSGNFSFSIR